MEKNTLVDDIKNEIGSVFQQISDEKEYVVVGVNTQSVFLVPKTHLLQVATIEFFETFDLVWSVKSIEKVSN